MVVEDGSAAGVAGTALRLEVGGGGAGVGEGLAAAELRRVGGVEPGEPLPEAGGAEAGDGDARVEAADGGHRRWLIHPLSLTQITSSLCLLPIKGSSIY